MRKASIEVRLIGKHPVIEFAAQELARFLGRMLDQTVPVSTVSQFEESAGIHVGLLSSFPNRTIPSVPDPRMDDAIEIDVDGPKGLISGINERSVLLAAYRYLTELGCRWVRPGEDGAFIPRIASLPRVKIQEIPSYRHRAVCIEGAVSLDHVRDMVDWIPKLGFNGYFIQFREAHTFFDRWYAHEGHPTLKGETLSQDQAREYTQAIEAQIDRRGLLYHKVGHGWTCEPFGISGLGWSAAKEEPGPEIKKYLAQVNGERKLWGGVALNTNLCYSNPEVREIMVREIVSYSQTHPRIDLLHIWLADGSNNNCECEACEKARPSDFYVMLLNELDEALTTSGLKTRIVFLIYVDLLWPPTEQRLRNPERFVLMFAPIVRSYSESFRAAEVLPDLPDYRRNKLDFPKGVDANVAFLRAWQDQFEGDSFDFDYHLMWDHSNDPGHIAISKTISQDMKGLKDIGLNGFVSCQIQRIFFPTALAMTVMGRTLWDRDLSFEDIARDLFDAAFGTDGALSQSYLTTLSELFDPVAMRQERPREGAERAAGLARIRQVIQDFRPVIDRNLNAENACHALSWRYLKHHAEICQVWTDALLAQAKGQKEEAKRLGEIFRKTCWDKEPELHRVFDTWLFDGRLGRWFR